MIEKIPTGKRIGIIGGGQLGYMLMEAGSPLQIKYYTLDNAYAPCAGLAEAHLEGSIKNAEDIQKLAGMCDILTFEIEHISLEGLAAVEASGKKVIPSYQTLLTIHDKGIQKDFYERHEIPTAPYRLADDSGAWPELLQQLDINQTFVIKTRTGGYDGKGVEIAHVSELPRLQEKYKNVPVVLEQPIEFITELSVIVARDTQGNTKVYDPCEMVFDPVLNLVDTLIAPARIDEKTAELSRNIAMKTVAALDDAGVYAVEQFLTSDGEIYVNETAPRPHNSGHHTIESCFSSQYDQLNRILCGWPLGDPQHKMPAAMINIIGPEMLTGKYQLAAAADLLSIPGVYIHMYGKTETRPGRKLGHITVLGKDYVALESKIREIKRMAIISKDL